MLNSSDFDCKFLMVDFDGSKYYLDGHSLKDLGFRDLVEGDDSNLYQLPIEQIHVMKEYYCMRHPGVSVVEKVITRDADFYSANVFETETKTIGGNKSSEVIFTPRKRL